MDFNFGGAHKNGGGIMDYGKVLGKAWEIIWRWKIIWVLGFLASLGQGVTTPFSYQYNEEDLRNIGINIDAGTLDVALEDFIAGFVGVAIAVTCLAIIIGIILWIVSIIARGGLIASVKQVEEEGTTSFGKAWRAGARKFWTLFGLGVLAQLPILILVIIGIVFLWTVVIASLDFSGGMDVGAFIASVATSSLLCICSLCCILLPLSLILDQIRVYGERAAILEDMGWIDAFKRGWQVIRENLGPTLIVWLIFLAISLVVGGITFVIMLAIMAPIFASFGLFEDSAMIFIPICGGALVMMIVFALIRSVVTAYTSATWTLTYRELVGMGSPPPAPVMVPEEVPPPVTE